MIRTEQRLNVKGTNIYLHIIGTGEPIIFLHGGPGGEHRFFLPHVEELSKDFQLILYDQTGCGQSEPSKDNRYSMDDEVEVLECIRKEFSISKLNLFGESWGSMLALLYATKYPEHVNKLLLTAAVGSSAEGFKVFGEEMEKRMSEKDKEKLADLEKAFNEGTATLDEIFTVLNPYYVFSRDVLTRKTKTTSNVEVNQIIGKDIMENYHLKDRLHTINHIPILVAQGSHDILTPKRIEELLMKDIPHAELTVLEDCGHWTVVEKPDEMNRIAKSFFRWG